MQNDLPSRGYFGSNIGRKQLIGITGLGLSFFLLTHMLGNMLILVSAQAYNNYAHALITNPLLPIAEIGLVGMFVAHMIFALLLAWMNSRARDRRYALQPTGDKATSLIHRSLWAQGLLILVFTILHLVTFKYGTHYTATYDGVEVRDLHRLVVEVFNEPAYIVWYVVALIVLGFHLSHGVGSSLQTFGIHHPRYQKCFRTASIAYAVIVVGGFLSQPIYVFFFHRG